MEINTFSERDNGIIDLDATIYCEKFMGTKVYLTTWVKVKENWRDSDFMVWNFGYSE